MIDDCKDEDENGDCKDDEARFDAKMRNLHYGFLIEDEEYDACKDEDEKCDAG